jgi:hypothetical protein
MTQLTAADIKAAVHEELDEQRQNFWVEPEEHWRHHEQLRECMTGKPEWSKNHEFISDIRRGAWQIKKTSLGVIVAALMAILLYKLFGIRL